MLINSFLFFFTNLVINFLLANRSTYQKVLVNPKGDDNKSTGARDQNVTWSTETLYKIITGCLIQRFFFNSLTTQNTVSGKDPMKAEGHGSRLSLHGLYGA